MGEGKGPLSTPGVSAPCITAGAVAGRVGTIVVVVVEGGAAVGGVAASAAARRGSAICPCWLRCCCFCWGLLPAASLTASVQARRRLLGGAALPARPSCRGSSSSSSRLIDRSSLSAALLVGVRAGWLVRCAASVSQPASPNACIYERGSCRTPHPSKKNGRADDGVSESGSSESMSNQRPNPI